MFKAVTDLASRMKRLDKNKLMKATMSDTTIQAQVIDLNRSQLYDKGVDATGSPTGQYASATIYGTVNYEGKIAKNQPYDHVTLKDSGASYASMKVIPEETDFMINANFPEPIMRGWPDALGLTEESRTEIKPDVAAGLASEIKTALRK